LLDQGEDPAALLFRQLGLASRSWPHAQASDPFEREPLQVDAHRLWMATQLGRNLVGRLAGPALDHHPGMELPISRRMMARGQFAHRSFFLLLLRCSRFDMLGHLFAPPSSEHLSLIFYHHWGMEQYR
jgi:hypothetical protein